MVAISNWIGTNACKIVLSNSQQLAYMQSYGNIQCYSRVIQRGGLSHTSKSNRLNSLNLRLWYDQFHDASPNGWIENAIHLTFVNSKPSKNRPVWNIENSNFIESVWFFLIPDFKYKNIFFSANAWPKEEFHGKDDYVSL